MWLIVGLGNPGSEYSRTRHNIGFMVADSFSQIGPESRWTQKWKSEICRIIYNSHDVVVLKPLTYMNLSGESVQAAVGFYKISPDHLIVVHDELDLEFGALRIQKNRGHGGHNGVKSIQELLGTKDFIRIRMGVGKPPHPNFPVADYVLSKFSGEEAHALPEFLEKGTQAAAHILSRGFESAATEWNSKNPMADKPKGK